jgi:hypothetical protein
MAVYSFRYPKNENTYYNMLDDFCKFCLWAIRNNL